MTSLFRPLLTSLLSCVIAVGHMPALLHLTSCHGHTHGQRVDANKDSSDVCSHGCNHHATDNSVRGSKDYVVENEESVVIPVHDSEHCAICHSLANPAGMVWNFALPLVQDCLHERASLYADRLTVATAIAIPQPRGPPFIS